MASCRAFIQSEQCWACFSCKWQDSVNGLLEFSYADTKGPNVIGCKFEAIMENDDGHRLLLVTMRALRRIPIHFQTMSLKHT